MHHFWRVVQPKSTYNNQYNSNQVAFPFYSVFFLWSLYEKQYQQADCHYYCYGRQNYLPCCHIVSYDGNSVFQVAQILDCKRGHTLSEYYAVY